VRASIAVQPWPQSHFATEKGSYRLPVAEVTDTPFNGRERTTKQYSDRTIYSRMGESVQLFRTMEYISMQNLHVVQNDDSAVEASQPRSLLVKPVVQWIVAVVVLFGLGTWFVWWAASVQRTLTLEDIRSACQRVMPETVERCVDTVIIQRGGARR
jgi:hypothetical protein